MNNKLNFRLVDERPTARVLQQKEGLLHGIDYNTLSRFAETQGVSYLGLSHDFPGKFPVTGYIWGQQKRMLVNMVVKAEDVCGCNCDHNGSYNIVFLVDPACPSTFLSETAIRTLVPDDETAIPPQVRMHIHSDKAICCRVYPNQSMFTDMNILGNDFFEINRLSLVANFDKNSLLITRNKDQEKLEI